DDLRRVDPKFQQPRFNQYLAAVSALDAFARKNFGKSALALAVRWVLDQGPTIALWGARRPEQVDAISEVTGWSLDEPSMREIDRAVTGRRGWPKQRLGARIRLFRRDEECAPDLGPADARQVSAEPRRPGPRHKNVRHGSRRRHAAARDRLPQIAVSTIRCEPVTRADEEHPMINLRVNGTTRAVDADPAMPLLWALRDLLGMTGTKYGCGI